MPHFIRGTDNDLTPLQHSNEIFKQYLTQMTFNEIMGKVNSGKPVQVDNRLTGKGNGDTVRYHFIPQNKTDGIYGQEPSITGNEDSLDEYFMDIKIGQVAKAFAKKGKLTDKRTIWDFRGEAKSQIANWFAEQNDRWLIDSLTGYMQNGFDYVDTLANLEAPTNMKKLVAGDGRCVMAKGSTSFKVVTEANSSNKQLLTAEGLLPTDVINTYLLDELSIIAKEGNSKYKIKPYQTIDKRLIFVLYISLKDARILKQDVRFEKYRIALVQGGMKDPIVTGAIGMWDNILIKECEWVRKFKDSSGKTYARNLLLGGDAAVQLYAQSVDYTEEMRDHNRILSMAADEIRGTKKLNFDGVDMGVMQVITASN